jgi:hypothetical protein
MTTSLNTYCCVYNARLLSVPMFDFVDLTVFLLQIAAMSRFSMNALKNYGFVHRSTLMLYLSSFDARTPYSGKKSSFRR